MSLPTKPDGTIDYVEATRRARLNPPASSPQELAEEIRQINAREQQRIAELTDNGRNLLPLQKERDADASNFRRQQEAEGKQRQEAEAKRLAAAIAARQAEMASNETPIIDRVADAKRRYDVAIAAIQEKAAEPIVISEEFGLTELARKQEIQKRFDAARAESLRPTLPSEKF